MGPMINDPQEALDLLRRHKVLPLTGPVSLVTEIAGTDVLGSWWAHPRGPVVYRIAEALEASAEVLVTKLLHGRVTFVHRALWPALYRLVTDETFRLQAEPELSPAARELWAEVERSGEVRSDRLTGLLPGAADVARARGELERRWLVLSASQHTDKGRHATVLRSWHRWAQGKPNLRAEAAALTLEQARELLEEAGLPTE